MSSVIVHYQELALKGRNRPWFVHTLVRTIRRALSDLPVEDVRALMGRIEVELGPDAPWPDVRERLAGLPGIGNFSLATHVAPDLDADRRRHRGESRPAGRPSRSGSPRAAPTSGFR